MAGAGSRVRFRGAVARDRRSPGFTLIEALLGVFFASVVLFGVFAVFRAGTRMEDQLSALLGFQLESQKAVVRFLQDLQEGIAVVQPSPGHTLPHAVIRDKENRMVFYSLEGPARDGVYSLRRDVVDVDGARTDTVVTGVARITFTAFSDASLQIHMTLVQGDRRHSFLSEVRMRNRDAIEVQ